VTPDRLPEAALRWVAGAIGAGSRVLSAERLPLGGWHVNHELLVADRGGRRHRLVLRRWARPGWERDDPDYTAGREQRILDLLGPTAVPAPSVVAADPAAEACDVPTLLLTRLPGQPPSAADRAGERFCTDLADTLARVHALADAAEGRVPPYRLYFDRATARPARWMPRSRVWAAASAAVRQPTPPGPATLIHRDYHPENTLWSRGRLTGLVDWTQASWGPPALDLGHMRWNLVADQGRVVADRFLEAFRAVTGTAAEDQPYWDLVALLDLLLDGDDPGDLTPADLRTFEEYAGSILHAWS
jgi:aminoglycoside phosphotransferase (APT) family kinase protein